jgi:hypothetical protein
MRIDYGINKHFFLKDEDLEFYKKLLEEENKNEPKNSSFLKKIVQVFNNPKMRANEKFIQMKIEKIPFFTTTENIEIIDNLGMINLKGNDLKKLKKQLKFEAYKKGANAIININFNQISHSDTKSSFNGIGASPNIRTKITVEYYATGDLVIIKKTI